MWEHGAADSLFALLFGVELERASRNWSRIRRASFANGCLLTASVLLLCLFGETLLPPLAALRQYAVERLGTIPGVRFLGGGADHILCLSLEGYPSQNIVNELDGMGVCVSAGSACHRGAASHVFTAMGLPRRVAAGAIRVSFGPETDRGDIDALAEGLAFHQKNRFPLL